MSKPKAADQTWRRIYHSRFAEVYESDETQDYYKVVLKDQRPKYLYGELAFQNYQRMVYDYELDMVKQSMTPTIYTKPNCVQCNATKKYFDDKGISYTTVDITEDPEALDLLLAEGFKAAPVVNAGTKWWSGFQPDLIDEYIDKYAS